MSAVSNSELLSPDRSLIAVGAMPGGTGALTRFVSMLPAGAPPVIVGLHATRSLAERFATRIGALSKVEVRVVDDGTVLRRGVVYLAPPKDLPEVCQEGNALVVRHCHEHIEHDEDSSIDLLLSSVAVATEGQCVGVLLGGAGVDGIDGVRDLAAAEAPTYTPIDEAGPDGRGATVVARLDAAERAVHLNELTRQVLEHFARDEETAKAWAVLPTAMSWDAARMALGEAQIDIDHQILVTRIDELHRAMSEGLSRDAVEQMFDFLEGYANQHFVYEEELMQRVSCPTMQENLLAHSEFVRILASLRARFVQGDSLADLATSVEQFLSSWLVNHICVIDHELGESLKRQQSQEGL